MLRHYIIPRVLLALVLSWAMGVAWQPPLHAQTIYRCGNDYSNTPCTSPKPNAAQTAPHSRKSTPPDGPINNQLSVLHGSTQAPPGQATVYLCKSHGGGLFWSSSHCAAQQALMERMESVPATMPWAQQVQQAQHQWEQAQRLSSPEVGGAQRSAPKPRSASNRQAPALKDSNTSAGCSQLHAQLEQLDQRARKGLTASDAEQVRSQRKALRQKLRHGHC